MSNAPYCISTLDDVDFAGLLADAELRTWSDKEERFVAEMKRRYGRMGGDMFIIDPQLEWIERIAERDLDDD